MRVRRLTIHNFRGVKHGVIDFPKHALLVGGNNSGKSTVCEALDLVLGPERQMRRPVVDEHDFHCGQYLPTQIQLPEGLEEGSDEWQPAHAAAVTAAEEAVTIRIQAILVDLSPEAERRFQGNLRKWDDARGVFVDEQEDVRPEDADEPDRPWALELVFLARYNAEEDDFEGSTFFAHPPGPVLEEDLGKLGAGLRHFSRENKRLCGFVYLRALRTGTRALSLQKGSLLDTILRLSDENAAEMWAQTLTSLRELEPAIGDIPQLEQIRHGIEERTRRFVGISQGDDATAFFASDLTREHLREVVRLFIATDPNDYPLPFQRHGTGTVNVLVFALLTFIADMKRSQSVIFAMEEPEIALPPHTQRRIAGYVLKQMGQAIVTSHSPYVIEQFDSPDIVVLSRGSTANLAGKPLDAKQIQPRMFRSQKRQFAEAILARAVIVVEGDTELVLLHAVSAALEKYRSPETYAHIDIAGVSVFNASSDSQVPRYGPVFAAMDKVVIGVVDNQEAAWFERYESELGAYSHFVATDHPGVEQLLLSEVPEAALRRFLEGVGDRDDYPGQVGGYAATMDADEVRALARRVLEARKGQKDGYAGVLIEHCESYEELPATFVSLLEEVHLLLHPPVAQGGDGIDSTQTAV